jgi:lipoyl-dependent peroxiredoxin
MDRTGSARWEGDLRQGNGTVRTGSGGCSGAYSFGSRFESAQGTNPEELVASAHAACFSMAFSAALSKAGFLPQNVATTAVVHLNKVGEAFAITGIDLSCEAAVPGIDQEQLSRTAEDAKKNCPVSKALAAVPITLKLTRV